MNPSLTQLAAELRPFIERCKAEGRITIAPPLLVGNMSKRRALLKASGLTNRGTSYIHRPPTLGLTREQFAVHRREYFKNYRAQRRVARKSSIVNHQP